jgi:aryl-alcohol dehydrogenase (NADP+)
VRTLGRSGIQVGELGLGTMVFGPWGNGDVAECTRIVHRALDHGVNLLDTADVYGFGVSEEIVGHALEGRRDGVVLATKFVNPMGDDPNARGASRRWIIRACEDSLRRLRTDRIDLYQVHRPDPATDLDETIGALSDLVHQGKVLAWGTSTFPAEELVAVQWRASRAGAVAPVCEQPPYSILARAIERDVLPTCHRHGVGVAAWSPLAGGWLTGKYRRDRPPPPGSRAVAFPDHFDGGNEAKLDLVEELLEVAADTGTTLTRLALAWALRHPAITAVLIGPRTEDQLADQLGAEALVLTDDVLDRIDTLVAPGTNVAEADAGYANPHLDPSARRR